MAWFDCNVLDYDCAKFDHCGWTLIGDCEVSYTTPKMDCTFVCVLQFHTY